MVIQIALSVAAAKDRKLKFYFHVDESALITRLQLNCFDTTRGNCAWVRGQLSVACEAL